MAIEQIINTKSLKILFQPIVCVKTKVVMGCEALVRGEYKDERISPDILFKEAHKKGVTLKLDTLCREIAVENYFRLGYEDKLLFLNFEISELNKGVEGKKEILKSIIALYNNLIKYNMSPENIVIEIIESSVKYMEDLKFFSDLCKKYGFLTALDDVGSGHSNLNRIPLLKPDIIKIDRYLINEMQEDYYKQEVFKAITKLSRMIGTLIIAEGVETKEEALYSIEHRADMIQGYYFCKPSEKIPSDVDKKILDIYSEFKKYFVEKTTKEKDFSQEMISLLKKISIELSINEFSNKIMEKYINNYPFIECFYMINSYGKQISDTIFDKHRLKIINRRLFKPAEKNDDHSLKKYFYQLKVSKTNHYITEPYISMATGNKCTTVSNLINKDTILTMDINFDEFSKYFEIFYNNKFYKKQPKDRVSPIA